MDRLKGRVALVTGAARGQGRSHAVRLAEEGADVIAVDICANMEMLPYPLATPDDLAETVQQVEALDRRIVAAQVDVRDAGALQAAVDDAVRRLGRLDVVSANAGVLSFARAENLTPVEWQAVLDVCLTGVWNTFRAAIPHIRAGGRGGSIVITSSASGVASRQHLAHYTSAKHGVIGLMKALALELAPEMIRVNAILPGSVNAPMARSEAIFRLIRPDLEHPTLEDALEVYSPMTAMPVPWVEPVDISNALLFLASDEGRYVTGVALPVDAGTLLR